MYYKLDLNFGPNYTIGLVMADIMESMMTIGIL